MSEITGEDRVMLQPPGIYHNNVLGGFVREMKTQRKKHLHENLIKQLKMCK